MIEKTDKVFLSLGLVLILLAIVFKFAAIFAPTPIDKKYRQKFYTLFFSVGFSEIIWYGLRYENVRFFGSHFVVLLVLLTGLVWLAFLTIKIVRGYGKEKVVYEKEQVKLKYLPK